MIDNGFNPYVVSHEGKSGMKTLLYRGSLSDLTIPEMQKSVYLSINPDRSYPSQLQDAWYYSNGIFPGNFEKRIGKGGEGVVLKGQWLGKDAAFKFIEIKDYKHQEKPIDSLKNLRKRLTEINTLKSIDGSCIIDPYGHYR